MPKEVKDLRKSTFSGAIWKFMERVCAQVVSLVVSIVLARLLLPEDYSVVSIVTIFFSFCNIIISGGLNTALIQKKDADKLDFATVLHTSMLLSLLLYAVMFFSAPFIASLYKVDLLVPVIRVMSLTFFINALKSVLSAYISGNMQFKKFFFSTIVGTVISAVIGIIMAVKGFGPWALVAQQMSNSFIDTVILFITTRFKIELKFSFKRLKELFSYGWKIFVSSVITVIYDEINPLIVGLKFSGADLAYYNKGKSFPGLLNSTISDTLAAVLFPAMSKVQDDKEAVLSMTRRYIKISSFVVFPLMAGFFAVADNFIRVLLTEKWLMAVPYVQIFSASYMLNIIQVGNLQAIKAIGRSDISLILEVVKKSIYFIIIALFVFLSGSPELLAISSIVCTLVATLINTFPNRKLIGYKYRLQLMDLLPNFIMAVIMCLIVLAVGYISLPPIISLILQVLAGFASYLLMSIVTKNENLKYLLKLVKTFLKREG